MTTYLDMLPDEIQQKIYYEEHKLKMIPIMANINNLLNGFCDITFNPLCYSQVVYDREIHEVVRIHLTQQFWKKSYYRRYVEDYGEVLILGNGWDRKVICGVALSYNIQWSTRGIFGYHSSYIWWSTPRPSGSYSYEEGGKVSCKLSSEFTKSDMKDFLEMNNIKYKSKHTRAQLIKLMMSF